MGRKSCFCGKMMFDNCVVPPSWPSCVRDRRSSVQLSKSFLYFAMKFLTLGFLSICIFSLRIIALPPNCKQDNYPTNGESIFGISCTRAQLKKIPQDLPKDINLLEIILDRIPNVEAASFVRYSRIKYLKLLGLSIETIEDDTFLVLKNLIHLDLSLNPLKTLPPLPSSLEKIMLDEIHSGFFSNNGIARLAELKSLTFISLRNNDLERIPKVVTELKTLTKLDVGKNNLNQLGLEDVAPLCNLKILDFTGNKIEQKEKPVCQCIAVQKWASEKEISILNLTCPEVPRVDKNKCKEDFKKDAERAHTDCKVKSLIWKYILIIGGILMGIAIIFLWCCWYCLKWKKASMQSKSLYVSSFCKKENGKLEEAVKINGIAA